MRGGFERKSLLDGVCSVKGSWKYFKKGGLDKKGVGKKRARVVIPKETMGYLKTVLIVAKSQKVNKKDNCNCNNKNFPSKISSEEDKRLLQKAKVLFVGDSLLNEINEKGWCKNHDVKVINISENRCETVLDDIDTVVGQKPDYNIRQGEN